MKMRKIETIMRKIEAMLIACEVGYYLEQEGYIDRNAREDEKKLLKYIREVLKENVRNH